jgi:hypothetical protein
LRKKSDFFGDIINRKEIMIEILKKIKFGKFFFPFGLESYITQFDIKVYINENIRNSDFVYCFIRLRNSVCHLTRIEGAREQGAEEDVRGTK